ncbi:MAG: Rrf2 family transcriptional regulator [Firmicutes bacterium]|jgi:Rrf2 family protein|nr:Rrf2 family transcriptional regulator [Bacillota bacterium]
MRLSSRTEYGVRAMFELASVFGGGPVALREVAGRQGLPESYLEQLFGALRKAGLVSGQRGSQGGYCLAREPSAITVGDIVRALEGPIALCECAGEDVAGCERASSCAAHPVWVKLRDSISAILDSTTLADMLAWGPGSDVGTT